MPISHLIVRVLTIVWIDLLLAGDNALVIAMAVRSLPTRQRRIGSALGAAAAVALRVGLTFVAAQILNVQYLKLSGGLFVLWIAVKVLVDASEPPDAEIKTRRLLQAVWYIAFAQSGKREMSLHTFRAEFSLPFTKFYDRHTPDVPMPQLESWFHASFKQAQDSVRELPHAREFLEFCRAKKLRTFLLSTVHADYFAAQCRVTGFDAFLDRPYTDVWDKRKKIHEILAENNLKPDETLFIGDMEHDIETAKHGGVHSCAVLTGYNTLEQLRAAQPDLIVEHLGELRGVLEQNDFLHLKPLAKKIQ